MASASSQSVEVQSRADNKSTQMPYFGSLVLPLLATVRVTEVDEYYQIFLSKDGHTTELLAEEYGKITDAGISLRAVKAKESNGRLSRDQSGRLPLLSLPDQCVKFLEDPRFAPYNSTSTLAEMSFRIKEIVIAENADRATEPTQIQLHIEPCRVRLDGGWEGYGSIGTAVTHNSEESSSSTGLHHRS